VLAQHAREPWAIDLIGTRWKRAGRHEHPSGTRTLAV
jgi:hypothetical protein